MALEVRSQSGWPGRIRSRSQRDLDVKEGENLVEQLPMLGRREHSHLGPGIRLECQVDRGHLDGLGSRADDDDDRSLSHGFDHGILMAPPRRSYRRTMESRARTALAPDLLGGGRC